MKLPLVGVFVLFGTLLPVFFVNAASLYMDPPKVEINRGDVISIGIRLDTDEGECINTVDATIHYTENIEPIDTSRGNSILSLWLDEPKIDKANRTITFAGGIPNGYCGRIVGDPRLTNTVMEVMFISPGLSIGSGDNGNVAKITFGEETRVLLNDGFGNDAPLTTFGSEVILNKKAGSRLVNEWVDVVSDDFSPPEDFSITLERTENAFGNRYFITFNTTDKQSGIDYYEVIEEPIEEMKFFRWGAADAPWIKTRSPYVLKDQSLNSTVRVRAYDKAGNEYVATLIPEESQRTMSNAAKVMLAMVVTAIALFILAALGSFWWHKRRKNYDDDEELEEDEGYEYEYEYEEDEDEQS